MLSRRFLTSTPKLNIPVRHSFPRPSYLPTRNHGSSSYFLKDVKGDDEMVRLKVQHDLALRIMDQAILHASIPKNLQQVAEVATGTGIWLTDLNERLGGSSETKFHGFDLTPRLFPETHSKNIEFSVHNMYDTFPAEHLGKYDLVHLRFIMLGMKSPSEVKTAITNISGLLKPGGYLQWEEYDFVAQYNEPKTGPHLELWRSTLDWVATQGYMWKMADHISRESTAAGMETIGLDNFDTVSLGPFDDDLRRTFFYALEIGIRMLHVGTRGNTPEVLADAEKDVDIAWEEIKNGNCFNYFLNRVVFRKPLERG